MFITFEGIEGSGKGTAAQSVRDWLLGLGYEVLLTREPGGCDLGLALRALLLNVQSSSLCPEAELFLYLADRAQHVREVIRPALAAGKIVISDRFADSTVVYQGAGRALPFAKLYEMNDFALGGLWPDLTLVLDLHPSTGLARARKRNQELGLAEKEGRFEAESLEFHHKIRQGYLDWAKAQGERMALVDAQGSAAEVLERIKAVIMPRLRAQG